MIGSTRQLRVYVHHEPVDMRKSFDTLSAIVIGKMHREVASGDVFVFVGKSRRRAKALMWDGTGLCLYSKRLAQGNFAAPWKHSASSALPLTMTELALLLEGSEIVFARKLSPSSYVHSAPLVFA